MRSELTTIHTRSYRQTSDQTAEHVGLQFQSALASLSVHDTPEDDGEDECDERRTQSRLF